MENGTQTESDKEEVQVNLAEHLKTKGYPPIWSNGPQEHKTRDFISQMKKAMELNKPLSQEDIEYFGIYKRITGKIEETFEYTVKYSRKELEERDRNPGFRDIREQLMDLTDKVLQKMGDTTQKTIEAIEKVSERAIREVREAHEKAEKYSQDAVKVVKESLDTMGKYYTDNLDKSIKSSENVVKYMSEALKGSYTLNSDLLKSFAVNVQTYDELSKKKLKEIVKLFEDKALEDPEKEKDFMDKLGEFLPVAKAAIEASGREVPAPIKAALDKFDEIQKNKG